MRSTCIFIFCALLTSAVATDAQATLNLSVSPLSGGTSLRFGRVSADGPTSREVRIRITSTDGIQYQVYHRVLDSFINEHNTPLAADAMSTYTLIGSNSFGTLYAQSPERLGPTDQLLYSSGQPGDSDAFTVVYAVEGSRLGGSGDYLGRIQYTARPVGGSGQDNVILNVTLETSGELKIEVEGSTTRDSVRLKLQDENSRQGYVDFAIRGNPGETIEISQEVEPYLQDELFNEVREGGVLYMASGTVNGELQPQALTPLTRKRVEVYSASEHEASFRLNYALDQDTIARQKAGLYKGRINYFVKNGRNEQMFDIQLEVEIEPVFAIAVDLPPQGLSFERLLPDSQPVVREVEVEVTSNLGRPYMIMQNVTSPMTNEEGGAIPEEYFTFKGEFKDKETGQLTNMDYQQVPRGEASLFVSDDRGSPARFTVSYRLRPYTAMVPGDYSTSIRYSLGEI